MSECVIATRVLHRDIYIVCALRNVLLPASCEQKPPRIYNGLVGELLRSVCFGTIQYSVGKVGGRMTIISH